MQIFELFYFKKNQYFVFKCLFLITLDILIFEFPASSPINFGDFALFWGKTHYKQNEAKK